MLVLLVLSALLDMLLPGDGRELATMAELSTSLPDNPAPQYAIVSARADQTASGQGFG
jgi:hypothetical protein